MKRRAYRLAFQTLTVVMLMATAFVVLGPLRRIISERTDALRAQAVAELESFLGRRVSYERISPSILNYLSVTGLRIHASTDEDEDLLSVDRLRLYYRPLRVLRGEYGDAISQIRIENSSVVLNFRSEETITRVIRDALQFGSGDAPALPTQLLVQGRNLQVTTLTEMGNSVLSELFFDAQLQESRLNFDGRGNARLTEAALPIASADGIVSGSGTLDVREGNLLAEVALSEFRTDLADFERLVLQVRLDSGTLEVRNVQSRAPIDLLFRRSATDELYARVLADGYAIGNLVQLRGGLAQFNSALSSPIQGLATLTSSDAGFDYSGALSGSFDEIPGLPPGRLDIRISGDEEELAVDQFDYQTATGLVSYSGAVGLDPVLPRGTMRVRNLELGNSDPITTELRFLRSARGFALETDPLSLSGHTVERLSWNVAYSNDISSTLSVQSAGEEGGSVLLESRHGGDWALMEASLQVQRFDLAGVGQALHAVAPGLIPSVVTAIPSQLRLDGAAALSAEGEERARISAFNLYDADDPARTLSLLATYDGARFRVSDISGTFGDQTLSGSVEGVQDENATTALDVALRVSGTDYRFSGTIGEGQTRLIGDRGAELIVQYGDADAALLRAAGEIPLPALIASPESRARFTLSGFYREPDDWRLDVSRFSLSGVTVGPIRDLEVTLRTTLSERGATLDSLLFRDSVSTLEGGGSIAWDIPSAQAEIDLSLATPSESAENAPQEAYTVVGTLDDTLGLLAVFEGVPLSRLGTDAVAGTANITLSAEGTLADPTVTARLNLANARFNTDPVELDATARFNDQRIVLTDTSARLGRTRVESVSGELDLERSEISARAQILQVNDGDTLVINASGSGTFDDSDGLFTLLSAPLRATVTLANLPSADGPVDWELDVTRDEESTRIVGGPGDAVSFQIAPDGAFDAVVGGGLPISFQAMGYVEDGTLEADLIGLRIELPRLWALLDPSGVSFTGGVGEGSLRIVGPLNDPDFFGTLVATSVAADLEWISEPAGPSRTFVVFEEKVVTIREAVVAAGAGAADISAIITLDRWTVEEYLVSIRTLPNRPLPVSTSFDRVGIDGEAAGTMQVRGTTVSTLVNGNLRASNTSITLGPPPEIPPERSSIFDVIVDISLETGRGVEFLWPTDAFPILRGFADTNEQVRIVYDSGSSSFGVDGAVAIQGGELFYFDRSFYISEGAISFAEDETEFDPLLSVDAEIREVSEEGPVTIFLIADARPLSQFTPQWRSDPPLSEAAILTLLGGNVFIADSGEPIDLSGAVLLTSDVVSQFGLIRNFESGVRQALNLDLFSIRTQLFQNLLRDVIAPEDLPLDSTVPSLGDYLDNTTLFVGRYLGTDLFLELLVQLRQAENDPLGQQSLTGIEIDSELSLEWDTPFFQLEWAFFPSDPSSLFLADNTIRFTWDYSY